MHSFRRAVLRSVATVSASAPTSAVTAPFIRSTAVASRSSVGIAAAATATSHIASATRFFSQSARVANAEESEEDVASKIASELAGQEKPATTAPASQAASGEETPYGVFVRNLVFDATEDHLKEAFSHYGPVTRAIIARDPRGLSKGFGFVWYENDADKQKAIQEADGMFWHGRRMAVTERQKTERRAPRKSNGPREPRTPVEPTNSLYIGNLPYETTDADLNEVFRVLEGVLAVRVAVDRSTGWPRGFAHADFDTVENATKAKEALTGRQLGTRELRLDFANRPNNAFPPEGKSEPKW